MELVFSHSEGMLMVIGMALEVSKTQGILSLSLSLSLFFPAWLKSRV